MLSHGADLDFGKKSSNRTETPTSRLLQWVFSRYGLLLFLAIIFLLAFVEEGLWDITEFGSEIKYLAIHPKYPGIAIDGSIKQIIIKSYALTKFLPFWIFDAILF